MGIAFLDGLRNLVANLGTDRDKASHSLYVDAAIGDDQLVAMYRTSAVARKIVDMPAEDSCREWREWQADAEQITLIEGEENRLMVKARVLQASKRSRLFGGAAVYIGTGESNPSLPLNPDRIGKGGLKYLTVLNRSQLTPGELQRDPRLPGYGEPIEYTMNTDGQMLRIHPSRLVILRGEELPDDRYAGTAYGWADSCLTSALDSVRNLDATVGNVASLVFEAKIDVIKIKGFSEGLTNGGAAYETAVLAQTRLAAMGKSINGTLLMDSEDGYEQKSASFATLPDLMDRFMQLTSAAASIPMTLLFGMSPGGLNASGSSDTRGYYDRVKVQQTLEMTPAMSVLDECLIRSALGIRPPELHYTWKPLWQPTNKERAEVGKLQADTIKVLRDMQFLPDEALADTAVNALTESGAFPGLEAAVAEYFTAPDEGDLIEGEVVVVESVKEE